MIHPLTRLTASGRCLVAGIVVAAGVPIVAWSMMGDQSEVAETVPNSDYAIRPWNVPAPVSRFIEVGAALALVAALAFLLYATATRRMRARWWWIIAMVGALGAQIGLLARTGTARLIGANIGFGIAVLSRCRSWRSSSAYRSSSLSTGRGTLRRRSPPVTSNRRTRLSFVFASRAPGRQEHSLRFHSGGYPLDADKWLLGFGNRSQTSGAPCA
jgi:hypothetical protein